jgi:hypothetical protein
MKQIISKELLGKVLEIGSIMMKQLLEKNYLKIVINI